MLNVGFAVAISALAFASVALLAYAIGRIAAERRSGAWRLARLARLAQPGAGLGAGRGAGARAGPEAGPGSAARAGASRAGQVGPMRAMLGLLARAFEGKSYASRIDRELARADIPLRGSEFLALNVALAVGGPIVGFAVSGSVVAAAVLAIAGALLPNVYLKSKQAGRLGKVSAQTADALVIMANSLRAGYSFLQAMDMVSREMPPPISDEFSAAMKEMGLGAPTEAALTALADRVGTDDMELVVTAVLIQRQIGGNLAEILDNIAHTIRERVRIRAEIRTLTAQGRLSGIIIGLLPVALGVLLFVLNPSYIMLLFSHPAGKIMIGMAAAGEIVGAIVIRRIVTIEV